MRKGGWRGYCGHKALRNAESPSQPSVDYSLFKRDLLTGLSRVLLSLRDTFAFQNPVPYHACLPVPMPGMGSQQRGTQQWGRVGRIEQKGKLGSSQYLAAVLMPSILHRHHSLSWTSRLDPSFLLGFHSWLRQDWMKVPCGLQPEHSIPSLSCHVIVRPNFSPLSYKDWASQKVCDYFPRERIKPQLFQDLEWDN